MATLPVGPHRVEEMLRFCLETAKQMLEANGGFAPFGAIIDGNGTRRPVVGDTGKPDPTAAQIYNLIEESMRAQFFRGEIVAGAIVADATVPPEFKPDHPDGIRITVESSSISRLVFQPYKKVDAEPGAAGPAHPHVYGELLGVNVRPTIFVAPTA
jgi:hypothetical protein